MGCIADSIVRPSDWKDPRYYCDTSLPRCRQRYQAAAVAPSEAKHVQFTTATTYYFHVAYGGSALPLVSGPPIGLAPSHCDIITTDVKDSQKRRSPVRKVDHFERIELLKAAAYPVKDIADFCFEAIDIRKSRLATEKEWYAMKRKREEGRSVCLFKKRRRMYKPPESGDET